MFGYWFEKLAICRVMKPLEKPAGAVIFNSPSGCSDPEDRKSSSRSTPRIIGCTLSNIRFPSCVRVSRRVER